MSEAKHTTGPWEVVRTHPQNACVDVRAVNVEKYDYGICSLFHAPGEDSEEGPDGIWSGGEIRDANARLIAAAPDLQTACVEAAVPLEVLVADAEINGCGTIAPSVLKLMREAVMNIRAALAQGRPPIMTTLCIIAVALAAPLAVYVLVRATCGTDEPDDDDGRCVAALERERQAEARDSAAQDVAKALARQSEHWRK